MPEETLEHNTKSAVEVEPPHVSPEHQSPPAGSRPRRSRGVRILIWLLVLAGFAVLIWVVMHHKTQAAGHGGRRAALANGEAVTITEATASQGDMGVYLEAIGTVTPVHTDTITSQASGMLTAVDYQEGQIVRQGQLLAQIDPRPYQAQLEKDEGTLAHDQGLLAQARIDLTRYQAAWAKNAIAKQTLDDQVALVAQDEGLVKSDQGAIQADNVNLSYCTITAPISGRVGLRLVDPGNVIAAASATPLVILTELQPITVVFTIPEDSVAEVVAQLHGKPLTVTAFDRTAQTQLATGTLLTLDNQIDTTTGTLKLRAIFKNEKNALFPNQFVNTRLLVKTLHNVTRIPSSAIQHDGTVAFVFLIQGGYAHIQNVTPGVTDSGLTAVTGIRPGDVVANSSFEKLQDGSKIALLDTSGSVPQGPAMQGPAMQGPRTTGGGAGSPGGGPNTNPNFASPAPRGSANGNSIQ